MKDGKQERARSFADDAWWLVPIACAAAALAAVAIAGAEVVDDPSPIPESLSADSVQTEQAAQAEPSVQLLQTTHAIAPAAGLPAQQPMYEMKRVQAY